MNDINNINKEVILCPQTCEENNDVCCMQCKGFDKCEKSCNDTGCKYFIELKDEE